MRHTQVAVGWRWRNESVRNCDYQPMAMFQTRSVRSEAISKMCRGVSLDARSLQSTRRWYALGCYRSKEVQRGDVQ
jgi:hypothetical protein